MKSKKQMLYGFIAILVMFALSGCGGGAADLDIDIEIEDESERQYYAIHAATDVEDEPADAFEFIHEEFLFSYGLDDNGFWQNIRALDYVELLDYVAMEIPAEYHQVSEESIQDIIDDFMFGFIISEQITDRAVVDGDTINIDFVGSIDGVEFDGGSTMGMGTNVTIGVTQFIDDFLEQLIGHMPETVVYVEVTFPEDYHEVSLQGAEALFVTTINFIVGEDIVPELTDDFVMENIAPFHGLETVDELIEDIRSSLQTNALHQYIHEQIALHTTVISIPEPLIRYYQQMMLHQYAEQGLQFGMTLEDILGMFGFAGIEEFLEDSRADIERDAKTSLILQAVAEDAGITASHQDVTDFFIENFDTDDFSMFEDMYGLPWLKQFIRNRMVIEYIIERAVML